MYADIYYVRSVFEFDKLTKKQQDFIQLSNFLSFYGRTIYKSSLKEGLFNIMFVYNSDDTSILSGIPSGFYNYTESSYESCLGDSFIEPYDPRCRPWYSYASQNRGYFFYEPYLDAVTGDLLMTISSKIENDKLEFYSVMSIDFGMSNIIKMFNKTQNKDSYTVLLHEFNNSIFYHPNLNSYNLTSWDEIEFKDSADRCESQLECLNEKNLFKEKLQLSIDFIKSRNYSVEQQINTDRMYQEWTRFGEKQISLVYPARNSISGLQDGNTYSYAIILTARVIKDNRNTLRLFNIFNANLIKIPLIIEIILLCLSILFFIFNYGYFQMQQVKNPIELLIVFLKRSILQQQFCQASSKAMSQSKQAIRQTNYQKQQSNRYSITKKSTFKTNFHKKYEEQVSIFSPPLQTETPSSPTRFHPGINLRLQQLTQEERKFDEQKINLLFKSPLSPTTQEDFRLTQDNEMETQIQQTIRICSQTNVPYKNPYNPNRNLLSPPLTSQKLTQNLLTDGEKNVDNIGNQSISPQTDSPILATCSDVYSTKHNKTQEDFYYSMRNLSKNTIILEQNFQQEEQETVREKTEEKQTILSGLKPLFLEMKIIKETFQMLERVINYQIDAYTQNSEDKMKTLFHFSKAKLTFQKLSNSSGHSRCYFNLGIIYLLKYEYTLACEYFEAAIQISLQQFGIDSLFQLNEKMNLSQDCESKDQLQIFCKRIFSYAYCLKQLAFQYLYGEPNNRTNSIHSQAQASDYSPFQALANYSIYCDCNTQNIQLLQKCLEMFQLVEKMIGNNSEFSHIFQIFLYQESLEVLIQLGQQEQIPGYLKKLDRLFKQNNRIKLTVIPITNSRYERETLETQQNTKQVIEDQYSNPKIQKTVVSNYLSISSTNIKTIITQIFKSKQKFLLGLIEKRRENYLQAFELLNQSLEEGTHYNPLQRRKILINLKEIFNKLSLSQDLVREELLDFNQNPTIDFMILIQLDTLSQIQSFENCIENFRQSNFFKKDDRISILTFCTEIDILMPFTFIENDLHWRLIIDTLKTFGKNIIQKIREGEQQFDWQQAICYALNSIQDYNISDYVNLKHLFQQNFKSRTNIFSQNLGQFLDNIQLNQKCQQQDRKKVILLFSKDSQGEQSKQQQAQQNFQISQKIFNHQKPIIYHLKDSFLLDCQEVSFESQSFVYESFLEEHLFISKVNKLRNLDQFNYQYEYLSVLNNF